MSTSLFFKIKSTVDLDKHRLLELFFKDWIDDSCNNRVQYKIQRDSTTNSAKHQETLCVDFEQPEDALVMLLKGIPNEFIQYLEIVKQTNTTI